MSPLTAEVMPYDLLQKIRAEQLEFANTYGRLDIVHYKRRTKLLKLYSSMDDVPIRGKFDTVHSLSTDSAAL